MNLWHEMKSRWNKTLASQPRWDGNRLAFTINTEGKRIPCAISPSALQNLSRHTHLSTSDLLVMDSRDKIEEIAARIFPHYAGMGIRPGQHMRRRHRQTAAGSCICPREVVPFAIDGAAPAGSSNQGPPLATFLPSAFEPSNPEHCILPYL